MTERSFVVILAETALEVVPAELSRHPAVKADSARRGKPAGEILLDRSLHHAAMLRLRDGESRGRPDIPYHVLLDVSSSPLYRSGRLDFMIHLRGDRLLSFSKDLRPPRSYDRFRGLIEQLLVEGRVGSGEDLMVAEPGGFGDALKKARPSSVVGLSRLGKRMPLDQAVAEAMGGRPCFVVGGFPAGHFTEEMDRRFDSLVSISSLGLDASLVACRLVYEIEKTLGVD